MAGASTQAAPAPIGDPRSPRRSQALAKFLQNALAQKIGITLTGACKFDDSLGDDLVNGIGTVRNPKGYASHFECNTLHRTSRVTGPW